MLRPKALVVVDIQQGFMQKGADRLVPEVRDLVRQFEPNRVYYLRYRNVPGSLFTKYLDWHEFLTRNHYDIVPDVLTAEPQIFDHYGYSPPPELIERLHADGIEEVGICGVDTDACVMAALFTLWDHNIRPIVLSAYCASSGGEHLHRAALDLMLRQFGSRSIVTGKL